MDELTILKELVMQKLDREAKSSSDGGYSSSASKTYKDAADVGYIIDTIIDGMSKASHVGNFLIKMARSSGQYSDAHVIRKIGQTVTFTVPVDSFTLGFKIYSLEELSTMGMSYEPNTGKIVFGKNTQALLFRLSPASSFFNYIHKVIKHYLRINS